MANPTFSVTVPDIHQGPGYLWWNVPMPANPGRMLVDTNGNPVLPAGNWAASTAYAVGQEIVDTNNNIERVVIAGTSGTVQPAWSTTLGAQTVDNTVTWQNLGPVLPMGASEGAATFNVTGKFQAVEIDQETAPVEILMTSEEATITATLKESSLVKISKIVPHSTFSSGTDAGLPSGAQAYEQLTVGGLVPLGRAAVSLVSPRRGVGGKYMVATLYEAYGDAKFDYNITRTKESVYKVTFTGLALLWRAQGDRLAQFYRQT